MFRFLSFFFYKKNNSMLVYRVVCCSHQSDCHIRVVSYANQIAALGYVLHQLDCCIRVCILHQLHRCISISCINHSV